LNKRKVQLIGNSTYTVSLPKRWAVKTGLEKGRAIALIPQASGYLVIVPDHGRLTDKKEGVIEVEATTAPDSITRTIIASYLNGCDRLTVTSDESLTVEQSAAIKRVQRKLVGLEMVDESSDMIILDSLINIEDLKVWRGLTRIHNVAAMMQEEAIVALSTGEVSLADSVLQRDDDVDRLHFLILRQLRQAASNPAVASMLGIEPIECLDLQSVTKRIEHIADHAENVARKVKELMDHGVDEELVTRLEEISQMAQGIHEGAGRALFEEDLTLANEVLNKRLRMKDVCRNFREELPDESIFVNVVTNAMVESLERIGDYGTDIAEVAINRAARQEVSPEIEGAPIAGRR